MADNTTTVTTSSNINVGGNISDHTGSDGAMNGSENIFIFRYFIHIQQISCKFTAQYSPNISNLHPQISTTVTASSNGNVGGSSGDNTGSDGAMNGGDNIFIFRYFIHIEHNSCKFTAQYSPNISNLHPKYQPHSP